MLESPRDRVTAKTPAGRRDTLKSGLAFGETHIGSKRSESGLTIDSVVHDEPTGIGDSLGFMRIASLVIVSESNGLATSAVQRSVRIVSDNELDPRRRAAPPLTKAQPWRPRHWRYTTPSSTVSHSWAR
jgi:hypothetical protein